MDIPFSELFFALALVFDVIALFFVLLSGFGMLYFYLRSPKKNGFHSLSEKTYHSLRRNFVHRVILALDFFLVADLIKLAYVDTIPGLIQILFIVVIRTILSHFLLKEADM